MRKSIYPTGILVAALFCMSTPRSYAQSLPFQNEIEAFKHQDSIQPPPQHAILFTGSSSFQKWKDIAAYFPDYTVINRGFGGSSLPDVIRYAKDIIFPYHPRQIVIYCGDNDLAGSGTVTAKTVYTRFRTLYSLIRSHDKTVSILYVSIKPSPSRAALMPKMAQANKLIGRFLAKQKNAGFVDVYHLMLDPAGQPIDDLFVGDKLHMNAKGYAIWQKAIRPYFIKE
ncbi:MAG: GDSL-type esterase/lipase family protein [Puia sp.]|nr:GDSL-type esterase/lipase family protein [Puia sp.]